MYVTFDTPLDITSGTDIKADSVEIKGTTVVFSFDATNKDYNNATEINIRAKRTGSLRTVKDADGNNANYNPSDDDLKKRTVIVTAK